MSRVHAQRISVVVPSFNQARWLGDTLSSLLAQGDENLEIIVMDGGSTDGSDAVIARFRKHLAHVEQGPDGGQSAAIARGFEFATGGILAWLNSDDMHLPWTLASWRDAFAREPALALVHGDRIVIDEHARVLEYRSLRLMPHWLLARMPWFAQETFAFRREAYDAVGGIDREMRFAMDYDLFVRLLAHGRTRYLPRLLGAFRWHETSKSATIQGSIGAADMHAVRIRYGLPQWPRLHPGRVAASAAVRVGSAAFRLLPHDVSQRPTRCGFDVRDLFRAAPPREPRAVPSSDLW
jgi:glycosyltransferase involved in cell wall biosynthesis